MNKKEQGPALKTNQSRTAVFAVLAAGILWGIINLFVKPLAAAGIDPVGIAMVRMIVSSFLVFSGLLIFDRKKLRVCLRDLWMFAGTGIVSIVLFNACYFYTSIHCQTSVAVVLLYTSPVFIMLLSSVLFHEKITGRRLLALGMTFSGCILVAGLVGNVQVISPLYLLTGLASGLFYGLYTIFGRVALKKYDSLTVTAYTFLFGVAGSLPFGKPLAVIGTVSKQPKLLLYCIGIGLVCTVLPYFFYTWGLERMASGKAAILAAVEPLVCAVLGMTYYGENSDLPKLMGIVLILTAMILLNLEKPKSE